MPDEKAPSSGAFLPASLMYFCSGQPMHLCSGVDRRGFGVSKEPQQPVRQSVSHIRSNRPEAMTAAIATRMAVIRSCNMLSAT